MKPCCTKIRSVRSLPVALALLCGGWGMNLPAQTADSSITPPDPKQVQGTSAPDHINLWNEDQAQTQSWMFHFQNTDIVQGYPGFTSPYEGESSLSSDPNVRETVSLDVFMAAHLWPGGELYADAEEIGRAHV